MRQNIEYQVTGSQPTKLDRLLKKNCPALSNQNIKTLIHLGELEVNGRKIQRNLELKPGDRVLWPNAPDLSLLPIPNPSITIPILHQDRDLWIVDKPAPIPSHPIYPWETDTLANAVMGMVGDDAKHQSNIGDNPLEGGLINRLDTRTSGLVMVARSQVGFESFKKMFQMEKATSPIEKVYIALVHGKLNTHGEITFPLCHDPHSPRRMLVVHSRRRQHRSIKNSRLLPAITYYKPLENFRNATLLEIQIVTGVMHQIRAHMSHLGNPIVGENVYTAPKTRPLDPEINGRYFLHAHRLGFRHPFSGQYLEVESPLPATLSDYLNQIV